MASTDQNAGILLANKYNGKPPSPPPKRVISLLGAATETIYRLGLGHLIVGRSHECDYPPDVLSVPCISRPRLDVNASSKEIDTAVRQKAADGEPIYKLDDEVLKNQVGSFDLLIAQDHCRVCAITPRDLEDSEAIQTMKACRKSENILGFDDDIVNEDREVQQLILKPSTLHDCLEDTHKIAVALGVPERGIILRDTLQERLDRVQYIVSNSTKVTKAKPRVALLEWCDPIMGCGYWIPELIQLAGGEPLHCPPPGGATPTFSFQTLIESKPDVVIFALCGFGLTRAADEIASSTTFGSSDRLDKLKSACGNNVYVVDGNYLCNRSGPRLVESCEALCEAMHPQLRGHFGHFGTELLTTLDKALVMAKLGLHTGSKKVRPEPFVEHDDRNKERPKDEHGGPVQNSPDAIGRPKERPDEVVAKQLKFIRNGQVESAFALNSIANQDRWCGADRFAAVLRSHNDFRRLMKESACVESFEEKGDVAVVRVSLPEKKEEDAIVCEKVYLLWTMTGEKQADDNYIAWRTEKVGMAN